ncbi:AAA family ATPase [Rathayibacter sp. AY1H3]|uniref:AAA family ATPase n=1 Tax=Rathayibacter sp. AY1H3 TaxID=2080567 RepID=UPI000CE887D1|nr:LuxR family transcriptional regulator [Rathayibacter sp. AY1H3]PPH05164.1 hypothetical protein C5C33_12200 [Rathayibacter sp. AY1H3]
MKRDALVVGRGSELARLRLMVDGIAAHGSALVIDGDAGVGKTTLVEEVVAYARARDVRVLRTAGSAAESGDQYAALQLLLHPLRPGLDGLPLPQRDALRVAFHLADGVQPTPLLAGLSALTLLSDAAADRPLLVVVEDLHRIDPESAWALRMLARRIGEDRVVVVMTTRDRPEEDSGLEHLHLGPLSAADSAALLDTLPHPPRGAARRALLDLARGNPLALVELTGRDPSADEAEDRAVTGRLESAFAERFAELDQPSRLAVLAVALGDVATAEEASRLANLAIGRHPDPSWIDRAVAASLLSWTPGSGLRFRHPLVQSAVTSVSRPSERAAVLRTLVHEHRDDPSRTLWWRSELATGSDGPVGEELAGLAASGLATGDVVLAAQAMERAAELTPAGPLRVSRLIDAAEYSGLAGRTAEAALLVHRAAVETVDPVLTARAAWTRETLPTGRTALSRGDLSPALAAVTALQSHGAVDAATAALLHLAAIAWDHNREASPGEPMIQAVRALALDDSDPRAVLLAAVTEPIARGDEVVRRALAAAGGASGPEEAWWLGYALNTAGEVEVARELLEEAITGLRARGDIRILPQALLAASMTTSLAGRFSRARSFAEEALVLGSDLGDVGFETASRACLAWFDAMEGVAPDPEAISAGSAIGAAVLCSSVMRATLRGSRAAVAVLESRPGDAVPELLPLLDTDDDSLNPGFAILTTPDLVDAALAIGDVGVVRLHAARLESLFERWHQPMIEAALRYAQIAVALADGAPDAAAGLLRRTPPPLPYVRARALLLVGDGLRRAGQAAEARPLLRESLAMLEELPIRAWADRARDALRAAGGRIADAPSPAAATLTPQELRICALASTGLSNRAIAQNLFLSPRTVGAHLYAAYRKLGIGGRGELAAVLGRDAGADV